MTWARSYAIRFVNPVTRLFAGWMPGFALLSYTGRKTGRTYQTPINVFKQGDHFIFALTYGSEESQWVKNVLAAGGCRMRRMGREVQLVEPELLVDPDARMVPPPLRFVGRIGRVREFVRMRVK
jgi:deazaflavin-dependent oxidoreductase (nitroreductase family)